VSPRLLPKLSGKDWRSHEPQPVLMLTIKKFVHALELIARTAKKLSARAMSTVPARKLTVSPVDVTVPLTDFLRNAGKGGHIPACGPKIASTLPRSRFLASRTRAKRSRVTFCSWAKLPRSNMRRLPAYCGAVDDCHGSMI